jgi:hypothetical protein
MSLQTYVKRFDNSFYEWVNYRFGPQLGHRVSPQMIDMFVSNIERHVFSRMPPRPLDVIVWRADQNDFLVNFCQGLIQRMNSVPREISQWEFNTQISYSNVESVVAIDFEFDYFQVFPPSIFNSGYNFMRIQNGMSALSYDMWIPSGKRYLDFDFDKDNFETIISYISESDCDKLNFQTNYSGSNNAYGNGATKSVYAFINTEICSTILTKTREMFVDINTEHKFWFGDGNIKAFCKYLKFMTDSGCLLEYHFEPYLLEIMTDTNLTKDEIELFVQKISPEAYAQTINLSESEMQNLTGYSSHADYYKELVFLRKQNSEKEIYEAIATFILAYFDKLSVGDIDYKLSGLYELTAQTVLSMCSIDNDFYDKWKHFVESLTNVELKQLLTRFGSTTSTSNFYDIHVDDYINVDISISICSSSVTLNKKLFENDRLSLLKMYFTGEDKISDNI